MMKSGTGFNIRPLFMNCYFCLICSAFIIVADRHYERGRCCSVVLGRWEQRSFAVICKYILIFKKDYVRVTAAAILSQQRLDVCLEQ